MITASDFWLWDEVGPDPWASPRPSEVLDTSRLTALITGPETAVADLDIALALMDLVRDDLYLSGTTGDSRIDDADMRIASRALERTASRAGFQFHLPFRDHETWRSFWIRKGAAGSWQARRDLLSDLFDEPYVAMTAAQDRSLESRLVEAVSPRDRLGWPEVDTEIGELRRHFHRASTPQDYRAVGNDCVHLTEALSRKVYVHKLHGPADETEPPAAATKLRLTRFIEAKLPGPDNTELRKFARAAIELSQAVKHSGAPTRVEAGVLADAVIILANLLRRLDDV